MQVEYLDSLTVPQVAQILQIDVSRVYRLIREGRLPGFRVGRTVRIRRAALEQFIRSQERSQTPQCPPGACA